jgi:transcriptional regulator with XRE-family HTH domain
VSGETVGQALRRWRRARGFSLRKLGTLTSYSYAYICEIETGRKPPLPEVIAACDRYLGAGGQLIAIAARSQTAGPQAGDDEPGLEFSVDWMEGIETLTTLWRRDAGRRHFLRNAAYVSTAFAVPVQRWLDLFDQQSAVAVSASEPPTTQSVRDMTKTFRRLDNLYGAGQIRSAVVQYLDAEVAPVLRGGTPETLGRGFLSAVAELTQLAGWLAYDCLDHSLGQRYFIQALRQAMGAQDRALGAEILAGMSHQAIFLRQPQPAVELAHAAYRTAERAREPTLVAEASAMKAHAYALLGKEKECTDAITEAETVLGKADRANGPHWISYLDEAYLAAISGHCFRVLGKQPQAERFARRSLKMSPGFVRGRLFNNVLLAGAHVLKEDIDQACAVGHEALDLTGEVSSARAITYIEGLCQQLNPWRTDRRVKEFHDRAKIVIAQW